MPVPRVLKNTLRFWHFFAPSTQTTIGYPVLALSLFKKFGGSVWEGACFCISVKAGLAYGIAWKDFHARPRTFLDCPMELS